MSLKQIITGTANELLGRNQDLWEVRMNICKKCPLFEESGFGLRCNPSLYLNPETGDTSSVSKANYYRGCGCRLEAKTRCTDCKCPASKW